MKDPLSPSSILSARLRSNLLTAPAPSASDAARHLCGVQAQDATAAALSLRPRGVDVTAADVERARTEERSLVRTWLMRGTLHLVATEDLPLLLPLFGPPAAAANARRRAQLGLDPGTVARALAVIQDFLASGRARSRQMIAHHLASRSLPHEGQATIHLLAYAAQQGIVCYGPNLGGGIYRFVLLQEWLPHHVLTGLASPPPRETAIRELARRYLAAYAPATPEDFAYWSGLSIKETRTAWPGTISPEPAAQPQPASPSIRLLPAFDTYLLGYRSRSLVVPEEHASRVHPGGGIIHPTVIQDGRAIATWRHVRRRTGIEVAVEPFTRLSPDLLPLLEAEVKDVGRFLGLPATLSLRQR